MFMCRSNYSAPIPPGHPLATLLFGGLPRSPYHFTLPLPALYKHSNHPFFQCPALIYHTNFSSDPEAAPGGGMGAEQFDRRISLTLFK